MCKKNNKGSTLITVIVAIAFVTILTSILLGTTMVNMSMKGIDRKVKDDFYYAERGLSDVFTVVGQESAKIAGKKYEDAFKQIGTTFATPDEAAKEFQINFLNGVYDKYKTATASTYDGYIVTKLVSNRINSVKVLSAGAIQYRLKTGVLTSDKITTMNFANYDDALVIPSVKVAATDEKGYQSTITTDIVIDCPTVDFLGTNAEVTDYAIIGCQGVYFTDTDTDNHVEVTGNIYGGVHPTPFAEDNQIYPSVDAGHTPLYGGINVYATDVTLLSNYVVSKGDINVGGSGSALTIKSPNTSSGIPAVWFDSMRTVKGSGSPKITINNANVFALNDLELNANNSTVKMIKGDYYGYNDKTISSEKSLAGNDTYDNNSLNYSADRIDNDSSAIIINGNKCTLDLSSANSLVLMGKAFVDFSSKGTVPTGYPKVAASAESLALQPNQQLYLVPIDFMNSPNPCITDNLPPSGKLEMNKTRAELDTWFGYPYVKTTKTWGDTQVVDDIFDTYKVNVEGEDVYYAYLKFNDKKWIKDPGGSGKYIDADEYYHATLTLGSHGCISSKAAFFDEVISATNLNDTGLQPSAYRLRGKVLDSIKYSGNFDLQNAVINTGSSAVIYGRNAIVNYDISNGTYGIKSNTDGLERFASYPKNLFTRYQMLCVFLDGKEKFALRDEINDISALQATKIASDWKIGTVAAPIKSPMDNFVLVDQLASKNTSTGNLMYIDDNIANAPYGACVVAPSYTITGKFSGAAFINGNVTIQGGAEVDGILMATGKITVNGGTSGNPTKIRSNKGLIQSRVDKELELVEKGSVYKDNFLITYLAKNGAKMYNVTPGSRKEEDRIDPDYNSFMHYENWTKGN